MSLYRWSDTDDREEGDGVCKQFLLLNVWMYTLRGVLGGGCVSCVELMFGKIDN